jgi:plastocyanin
MRVAQVALALAVAAATAGCGGSGDSTPVATNHVTMVKSYRFDPEKVVVHAGDTVTWRNDDNFTHTVHVDGQDDHTVKPGDSVSIAFPKAGTFHYVCRLHSHDMEGEVIVR